MKPFLTILLLAACAATGYGQTIKALGYNTTNGEVVAATNVVWTNAFTFSTNTVAAQVRTNLGLGASDEVMFNVVKFLNEVDSNEFFALETIAEDQGSGEESLRLSHESGGDLVYFGVASVSFPTPVFFGTNAAATRTNLGIPWTGLTNTNAATFQSALFSATNAAPTNTNAPTPDAWVDITVGTNTYKLPLWQ